MEKWSDLKGWSERMSELESDAAGVCFLMDDIREQLDAPGLSDREYRELKESLEELEEDWDRIDDQMRKMHRKGDFREQLENVFGPMLDYVEEEMGCRMVLHQEDPVKALGRVRGSEVLRDLAEMWAAAVRERLEVFRDDVEYAMRRAKGQVLRECVEGLMV